MLLLNTNRLQFLVAVAAIVVGAALVAGERARPAEAAFHFAEIDEVMFGVTSEGANVQYVEIDMLATGQNITTNTHLSAWNANGTFFGILLIVPGNVPNQGTNVRWIMASTQFAAAAGITPDFTYPAATLPSTGMICWGAPGAVAPDPSTWDETNPLNYTDCVPYGGYAAANIRFGPATALGLGDGFRSLTRISHTNNTSADFALRCPTPQNNAGAIGSFDPCSDSDTDSDGINDINDNCPAVANPGQEDGDADFLGDACEASFGTNVADPDTDDDSCEDGREVRVLKFTPGMGGDRDPLSGFDFFDVPVPALTPSNSGGTRNEIVSLSDVLAVLIYVGTTNNGAANSAGVDYDSDLNGNAIEDGVEYDRTPSTTVGKPWRSGPPNNSVSLGDALVALAQVGHNCSVAP